MNDLHLKPSHAMEMEGSDQMELEWQ